MGSCFTCFDLYFFDPLPVLFANTDIVKDYSIKINITFNFVKINKPIKFF